MTSKDLDLNRINYLAVIAAALAMMAIGGIWYSPNVFGTAWLNLSGMSAEQMQGGMVKAYAGGFVVALVSAFALALLIDWTKGESWRCGAIIAVVAWLGFVATTRAYGVIFAGRPMALFFLDSGYDLVGYVAMGAIIGGWQKKRA